MVAAAEAAGHSMDQTAAEAEASVVAAAVATRPQAVEGGMVALAASIMATAALAPTAVAAALLAAVKLNLVSAVLALLVPVAMAAMALQAATLAWAAVEQVLGVTWDSLVRAPPEDLLVPMAI